MLHLRENNNRSLLLFSSVCSTYKKYSQHKNVCDLIDLNDEILGLFTHRPRNGFELAGL
jgi:hypothetical protein